MRRSRAAQTRRSPQWVQGVDDPEAWAVSHQWLLEAAFAAFDRTAEWPLIEDVQRDLAAEPERAVAVPQLVLDIPPSLGARMSQRVELTVRALAHVPDAAPLLELLVLVMREAVSLYPGEGPEQPALRGSQIKEHFDLDDATYRKLSTLVFSEGWFFNGGGGSGDGDWHRFVRGEILHLREVPDIDDYLDAVARYRFGAPEIEAPRDSARAPARWAGPYRWLYKRDVTVIDLLLITVLGGIVVGIVVWLLTR